MSSRFGHVDHAHDLPPRDLISETSGAGATSYYLGDGLGSTVQLASPSGAVTDSYTYDVFGAPRSTAGTTANDFRFTGEQNDRNANRGLYYLRARHYDPALGRFLSKDQLDLPDRYGYAHNNPVNATDPTGLDPDDPPPFPLPAPGTEDLFNRCLRGFVWCIEKMAPEAEYERRARTGAFDHICTGYLMRCRRHAAIGDPNTYFDYEGAKFDMLRHRSEPDYSASDFFGLFRPNIRIRIPNTGSGGYRGCAK